jgi:hypothetical protein
MRINIHWGEFRGPVERTEVKISATAKSPENMCKLYKYDLNLRGYLPFVLLKNMQTGQWLNQEVATPAISKEVIGYAKQFVDDYEHKHNL